MIIVLFCFFFSLKRLEFSLDYKKSIFQINGNLFCKHLTDQIYIVIHFNITCELKT